MDGGRRASDRSWRSFLHYLRRWTADRGSHTILTTTAAQEPRLCGSVWRNTIQDYHHYHVLVGPLSPSSYSGLLAGPASILLLPSSLHPGRVPVHSFDQTFEMNMAISSQRRARSIPRDFPASLPRPTPFSRWPKMPLCRPPYSITPTNPPQPSITSSENPPTYVTSKPPPSSSPHQTRPSPPPSPPRPPRSPRESYP